jgi:hypothetical protein
MGERRCSFIIFNLGTRWRWVVGFTPQALYPRENSPQYPLYRRLGRPQYLSARYGEGKNVLTMTGIDLRLPCRPARSLVPILTELSRLYIRKHSEEVACKYLKCVQLAHDKSPGDPVKFLDHNGWAIYWLDEQLLGSQGVECFSLFHGRLFKITSWLSIR